MRSTHWPYMLHTRIIYRSIIFVKINSIEWPRKSSSFFTSNFRLKLGIYKNNLGRGRGFEIRSNTKKCNCWVHRTPPHDSVHKMISCFSSQELYLSKKQLLQELKRYSLSKNLHSRGEIPIKYTRWFHVFVAKNFIFLKNSYCKNLRDK